MARLQTIRVGAATVAAAVWLGASSPAAVDRQTAPKSAQFEEASVRECDPDNIPPAPEGARGGGPNTFQMTPGRLHIQCMTLATIIRTAYGYGAARNDPGNRNRRPLRFDNVYGLGNEDGLRVRGGPDWVRSERYSIDAVAADASDPAALQGPMLQALLEDRFKLQTHVDHDEVQVLRMTVAKGGSRLTPAAAGSCEEPPDPPRDGRPTTAGEIRIRTAAEVRAGQKPTCGIYDTPDGGNRVMVAGGGTLNQLIVAVVTKLREPVVDETGLTGTFNFILEYPGDDPQAIVRAMEPQLGIVIGPGKTPRVFLVVDRVERPSAN